MANNMMKAYKRKMNITFSREDVAVMADAFQALYALAAKEVFGAGPKRLKRMEELAQHKLEELARNSKGNKHDFRNSTRDYAFRRLFEEYHKIMGVSEK